MTASQLYELNELPHTSWHGPEVFLDNPQLPRRVSPDNYEETSSSFNSMLPLKQEKGKGFKL